MATKREIAIARTVRNIVTERLLRARGCGENFYDVSTSINLNEIIDVGFPYNIEEERKEFELCLWEADIPKKMTPIGKTMQYDDPRAYWAWEGWKASRGIAE